MTDVTTLPIWHDCPFLGLIPDDYEIRRGKIFGHPEEIIAIWHPKWEIHSVCSARSFDAWGEESPYDSEFFERMLAPFLANIVQARYNKTHSFMGA